ncbi:MAG TPA: Pvc16 family protein [Pyrinomonadaceae bacterium]|jgi:hypothetical protein
MIRDLSLTLQAMLDDPALAARFPELAEAQVSFDRPSEKFAPPQPTIDLFLYDIRENVELRSNEPLVERRDGAAVIRRPPMRVACTYLVTAWPVGGAEPVLQEHRLLGQVLQVLAANPTIPPAYLVGSLAGQEPPLPLVTTQPEGLKNPSEFWTAVGNKLRPSVSVTVTVSLDPYAEPEAAPLVTTKGVVLEQMGDAAASPSSPSSARAAASGSFAAASSRTAAAAPGGAAPAALSSSRPSSSSSSSERFAVGGRVTDAAGRPVAGASLTLVPPGVVARTDAEGRFVFSGVRAGRPRLRVRPAAGPRQSFRIEIPAPPGGGYDVQLA